MIRPAALRPRHAALLACALAVVLAAASCGGERGRAPRASGAPLPPPTGDSTAAAATAAPDGAPDAAAEHAPRLVAADAERLLAEIRRPGARATLVNVWATWCQPCRAEFPDLLRLERTYRPHGLRFMLVSADFDSLAPRAFLAEHDVAFASWYKEDDDQRFINALSPQWSGALPATFVYDAEGRLVRFWEGRAEYAAFEEAVLEAFRDSEPTP